MPVKHGNKEAFLGAFAACGVIGKAAKIADTRRELHHRWLKKDPAYRAAFDAVCAELAVKRAEKSHKAASPSVEDELRAEMRRLRASMRELGKSLRRRIGDLEAKLETAAPRVRRAPPSEGDALLDDIAKGQAGKPFAKLDPARQDAVRDIAARLKNIVN